MENSLPFNQKFAWVTPANIGIGLALGAVFGLLSWWAVSSLSEVSATLKPPTLTEQLSEVYQSKLEKRLIKSNLLVQQAGLEAEIQKVESDLDQINQDLLSLNEKEIDLSLKAVASLGLQ